MTDLAPLDAYGALADPTTLKIQRLLPGPIERVWAYLTESELRRQWLASGEMAMQPGAEFELVWRNDSLTDPAGAKPDGFGEEHRLQSRILDVEAPRRLAFTWGAGSEVSFELEPQGGEVLLTVLHKRAPDRGVLLNVAAGWHAHLDVLTARLSGRPAAGPFWDNWVRLKVEYETRLPG